MKRCLVCDTAFASAGWTCPTCGASPELNGYPRFAPALAATDDDFPPEAFDVLADLEPRSFWFRGRNRLISWAVARYFPTASTFFDVGCGNGYVLAGLRERIASLELAGGDPYDAGIAIARRRVPDATLVQMDGRDIPFTEEFDVVGSFDVLEHVDEDEAVLAEMHRAVKPHGGVIVSVPQHPFLWSKVDEFSRHKRRYRRRELVEKLERAGFGIERVTSFVSLLLPAVMLSRLAERRSKRPFDPLREYRTTRAVDRALEAVMSTERACIAAGVDFPVGASLLAIGRRA